MTSQRTHGVNNYQVTLDRLLIASGQPDRVAPVIARIRQMGHVGQNAQVAGELEQLAANACTAALPMRAPSP